MSQVLPSFVDLILIVDRDSSMRFTYQSGVQPLAGYTIQRGIHRGGFGEVYFARSDAGKEVALKLLHREDQDVEIRGVTQCLNLKHPNLVNLFDLKTDSLGDTWVVMEYVSGSSLEDVLASFPDGLPLNEVRDWLSGLVAGVAYLHDRGIVHRDLKPANVYRENGVVKVGDVGLSKRLDSDHRRQHTQSVGTVYYMAPEVARGQYGPEVDVYSLGVMLYELITGKLPFTGETTAEILMKHLTAQPDLTPIPKSLRPTIARALEKDPRQRTPTVRDLERDFLRGIRGPSDALEIPEAAFLPRLPPVTHPQSNGNAGQRNTQRIDRPPTGEGPLHNTSSLPGNQVTAPDGSQLTKVLIVLLALFLLYGRFNGEFTGLTMLAAFGAILYFLRKNNFGSSAPLAVPPRAESIPVDRAYQSPPTRQSVSQRFKVAPSARQIDRPWKERWPEVANSLGHAALIASLVSLAIYLWPQTFPKYRAPVLPSGEHAILFAATSMVGSWIFLIGHALTTGTQWTNRHRWFARLGAGVLLGTFAYFLDDFLMVNIPPNAFTARSAMSSLGAYPLTGPGVDPTWLGYVCFFASWMGIRRWNREIDSHRARGLRIWTLLGAVTVAYFVAMVFKFPQWYAVLWAGTISTTVQLASSWTVGRGSSDFEQTTFRTSPLQPPLERR